MKIAIIILSAVLLILCLIAWKKPTLIKRTTLHVWCDWLATMIVAYVMYKLHLSIALSLFIALLAGIGAAWGKEYIWDKDLKLGTTDPVHAWYSTWGCLIGLVCSFVTFMAINGNGV